MLPRPLSRQGKTEVPPMRPTQRQRYAQQIDRLVRHLHALDWSDAATHTDLEKLAAIANLSPWHFHRVFRLMTGESLGEMVRRLRVAKGAALLRGTPGQVTQAAMASGYATPQAFARAVRRVTGLSPTDLPRSPDLLARLQARTTTTDEEPPLSVEITSVDPFIVQAMRNVGDYRDLDTAFTRLFEWVFAEHSMATLQGIYGIALDDPLSVPPAQCHFECAVKVDAAVTFAPPVRAIEIGGGTYVVGHHRGDYNLAHAALDELYAMLLDSREMHLADAPVFMWYRDDPEARPAHELRADIYVPIEWES
jgi:AraC family transcriptional regulator